MTPWWKRAELWLLLVWTASHLVRWARGRVWAVSSEPGPWWELLWATVVLGLAVYMGATGASLVEGSRRGPTAAPFGSHTRSVILRAVILAGAGGAYGMFIRWSDREPLAGALALALALAAVALAGGAIELRARGAGACWHLAAATGTALITVPGVLVAIAQAKYADAVQTGAAPEQALEQTWQQTSTGAGWATWFLPIAVGAGVGHAVVTLARLRRSPPLLVGGAVAFCGVFAAAILGQARAETWSGVELGLSASGALMFLVFLAFSAWAADALEQWWWGTSDGVVSDDSQDDDSALRE